MLGPRALTSLLSYHIHMHFMCFMTTAA